MINCGHCGGAHASVREVRECSMGEHAGSATPAGVEPPPGSELLSPRSAPVASAPARIESVLAPLTVEPAALAGPHVLGRCLLVNEGAPIPAPWDDGQ